MKLRMSVATLALISVAAHAGSTGSAQRLPKQSYSQVSCRQTHGPAKKSGCCLVNNCSDKSYCDTETCTCKAKPNA